MVTKANTDNAMKKTAPVTNLVKKIDSSTITHKIYDNSLRQMTINPNVDFFNKSKSRLTGSKYKEHKAMIQSLVKEETKSGIIKENSENYWFDLRMILKL